MKDYVLHTVFIVVFLFNTAKGCPTIAINECLAGLNCLIPTIGSGTPAAISCSKGVLHMRRGGFWEALTQPLTCMNSTQICNTPTTDYKHVDGLTCLITACTSCLSTPASDCVNATFKCTAEDLQYKLTGPQCLHVSCPEGSTLYQRSSSGTTVNWRKQSALECEHTKVWGDGSTTIPQSNPVFTCAQKVCPIAVRPAACGQECLPEKLPYVTAQNTIGCSIQCPEERTLISFLGNDPTRKVALKTATGTSVTGWKGVPVAEGAAEVNLPLTSTFACKVDTCERGGIWKTPSACTEAFVCSPNKVINSISKVNPEGCMTLHCEDGTLAKVDGAFISLIGKLTYRGNNTWRNLERTEFANDISVTCAVPKQCIPAGGEVCPDPPRTACLEDPRLAPYGCAIPTVGDNAGCPTFVCPADGNTYDLVSYQAHAAHMILYTSPVKCFAGAWRSVIYGEMSKLKHRLSCIRRNPPTTTIPTTTTVTPAGPCNGGAQWTPTDTCRNDMACDAAAVLEANNPSVSGACRTLSCSNNGMLVVLNGSTWILTATLNYQTESLNKWYSSSSQLFDNGVSVTCAKPTTCPIGGCPTPAPIKCFPPGECRDPTVAAVDNCDTYVCPDGWKLQEQGLSYIGPTPPPAIDATMKCIDGAWHSYNFGNFSKLTQWVISCKPITSPVTVTPAIPTTTTPGNGCPKCEWEDIGNPKVVFETCNQSRKSSELRCPNGQISTKTIASSSFYFQYDALVAYDDCKWMTSSGSTPKSEKGVNTAVVKCN